MIAILFTMYTHKPNYRKNLCQAKQLITTKSWWDSVDMLACHLVGPIVLRNKQIGTAEMREWLTSDNMWVRRSSILHQLAFSGEILPFVE
jgi:3-methyladenine DNA glycosylase AlkD